MKLQIVVKNGNVEVQDRKTGEKIENVSGVEYNEDLLGYTEATIKIQNIQRLTIIDTFIKKKKSKKRKIITIKAGTIVVTAYGYNSITGKPFQFLYDFGYYNNYSGCVCYTHGENNMQNAHCFDLSEIRIATKKDLKTIPWGH